MSDNCDSRWRKNQSDKKKKLHIKIHKLLQIDKQIDPEDRNKSNKTMKVNPENLELWCLYSQSLTEFTQAHRGKMA